MKRNILKINNKIIAFLLSVLGIGAACTFGGCEYGTPDGDLGIPQQATFKVQGKVTSEDNTPIPNIKVVMHYDTTHTTLYGNYNVQVNSLPKSHDFSVNFKDIDGTINGSYQSKDTIVSFVNPTFVNGNGDWYEGETSKQLHIKLKKNN